MPTVASNTSNASTASPTPGKRPRRYNCDPATHAGSYEVHGRIIAGTLDDHLARLAATWIDHHDTGRSIAVVASTNDHVGTINQAIQTARLDAGHLDPTTATRVAAGEITYVGDLVATRRNDRRLITNRGEPVRNRDNWTVTAICHDGSITVSHQTGHGEVTLPADYVRDHVRLGYAATEHGWQSDTVDTAIALASPATTRRGLYVAATRGRKKNTMCVVTDSDDIAEARDVLEAVLFADRADVPATTQRRALAQSTPRQLSPAASTPRPRCEIPEWFPTVLADARRDLLDAQTRDAERAAQRLQAIDEATRADTALVDIAASTATDRDALRHAEARATDARRVHAAAVRRLDAGPRRHRRMLRHDLDVAEQQLDRAENYLERTRQRTGPAVERHVRAVGDLRDACEQLRNSDMVDRLDAMLPSVGERRLRVQALETWEVWAQGHDVPNGTVRTALAVLEHRQGPERQLAIALSNAHGARNTQVVDRSGTAMTPASRPELGLEL